MPALDDSPIPPLLLPPSPQSLFGNSPKTLVSTKKQLTCLLQTLRELVPNEPVAHLKVCNQPYQARFLRMALKDVLSLTNLHTSPHSSCPSGSPPLSSTRAGQVP